MGSIQERTNRKGEKSYVATLRVKGHPAACRTFSRRTDAKVWIVQEKAKIQQGLHLDSGEAQRHTLSEAVERFIREERVHHNRLTHLNRWKTTLGALLLSAVSEVKVNDVTSLWRSKGPDGEALGGATINRYLTSLSVVFDQAVSWGWTRRNPTRDARKYIEPPGRTRFLSADERERLLNACRISSYRPLELIVTLALSTGMRKEELLSLQWPQVDSLQGVIILIKTKNKSPRRVYVRGRALELLRQYAKVRRIDSEYLFPGEKPSPRKVCKAQDAAARHFDVRKPWQKALRDAKISDFHFHDLRHSCASYLAMNGATSLEIAEVLGHKSLDVVKRYAHLSDTHTAMVVEKMNERFLGGCGA